MSVKIKEVKLYSCNKCGKKVRIRSKGLCPACRAKEVCFKKPKFHSAENTKKRAGYSDFFNKHIEKIKQGRLCCEECGQKLKGDVSEIAHILSKRNFPEIATSDWNVLYLCGMFSENQCHEKFDRNNSSRKSMRVFKKACEVVKQHENEVKHINNEFLQLTDN